MEEIFDEELRNLVRFKDATVEPAQPEEADKVQDEERPNEEAKNAQKLAMNPMDAKYPPVKKWYDERIVNMVKWVAIFIGLEYLVFYWQQTEQMQESAAVPSMIVCALMAGISVGKNWKWRN